MCMVGLMMLVPAFLGAEEPATGLEGRIWLLTHIRGVEVQVSRLPRLPTLTLNAQKLQASGFAGVNRFGGNYALSDHSLKLTKLISTRMAGAPEAMRVEGEFMAALEKVTGWKIDSGVLNLLAGEEAVLSFSPAPSPSRQN